MRYPKKLEIIRLVEHFRRSGDLLTFCRSAARPEQDEIVKTFMARIIRAGTGRRYQSTP